MASKKFSRLSIMLEAQDGMSKPMQTAAKASQQLQQSVSKLSQTMNKGTSTDKFAQSMKQAEASTTSFTRTLLQFSKDSAVAYAASKTLSKGWEGISTVAKGLGSSVVLAASSFKDFVASTKGWQSITGTIDRVNTSVKQMGQNIRLNIRDNVAWQALQANIGKVRMAIGDAGIATKNFTNAATNVVKNSTAYKSLSDTITKVKTSVVGVYGAFTIWKNSSTFVQKVNQDMQNMKTLFGMVGTGVSNMIVKFKSFKTSADEADKSVQQLGQRRTTFNQLADANAKLNKQLDSMRSSIEKSNNLLGSMADKIKQLGNLEKLRMGAEAIQGVFETIKEPVKNMIEQAAAQQQASATYGIITGSKSKGQADYSTVLNWANGTQFSNQQWLLAEQPYLKQFKTQPELLSHMKLLEQMATFRPNEGLQGATRAIQELAGGNTNSMAIRFGVPKAELNAIKKNDGSNLNKIVQDVSKYFGNQYGFSSSAISEMKTKPEAQLNMLKTNTQFGLGELGQGMLNAAMPSISKVNGMFRDSQMTAYINKLSDALGKATTATIKFGKNTIQWFNSPAVQRWLKNFSAGFGMVVSDLGKEWPSIKAIFSNILGIISQVVKQVTGGGSGGLKNILTVFNTVITALKVGTGWINKNFKTIEAVVAGVAAAFVAWKAIQTYTLLMTKLKDAIVLWRAATTAAEAIQAIFNVTLAANPIGIVVVAIGVLVTGIILLVQHWKTVIGWLKQAWTWFTNLGLKAQFAVAMIVPFIGIPALIISHWGKITSFFQDMWKKISPIFGAIGGLFDKVFGGGNKSITINGNTMTAPHSHYNGLPKVPYDGYQAVLHKDERVLTANQASTYNKGNQPVVITGNTFNVRQDSDIDAIANALYNKLYSASVAMG